MTPASDNPSRPSAARLKLLLIEDDETYRHELRTTLNRHERLIVTGEATCWSTAESLLQTASFDIALIDLNLGDRMAHDLIALGSQRGKVVVYSVYGNMDAVLRAVSCGAVGYLHKDAPAIDLAETLVSVSEGHVPISPTVAGHLLDAFRAPTGKPASADSPDQLTDRELEVLGWLARGLTIREVAERCGISRNTVSFHTKQIYGKLRVSSRSEAVYQALNSGAISVHDP